MPLPSLAVGDIVESRFRCRWADQIGLNIVHYVVTASGGLGRNLLHLAENLFSSSSLLYADLIHSGALVSWVDCLRLFPAPRSVTARSTAAPVAGGVTGNPNASQVCGLITKLSLVGGGHGRGRMYVPFPGVISVSASGGVSAAHQLALAALGADLLTGRTVGPGADTVSVSPVLLNRSLTLGPGAITLVDGQHVSPYWATQRSRGDFGSTN